jgi:hypothetical protein
MPTNTAKHTLTPADTVPRLHDENAPMPKLIPKSLTHNGSTLSSFARVKLDDALYVVIAQQSSNGLSFTIVYQ